MFALALAAAAVAAAVMVVMVIMVMIVVMVMMLVVVVMVVMTTGDMIVMLMHGEVSFRNFSFIIPGEQEVVKTFIFAGISPGRACTPGGKRL